MSRINLGAPSEVYRFTAFVRPLAKKRVRVYRTSRGVRGVNPSSEDEEVLRRIFREIDGIPEQPIEVACLLGVRFYKLPPKSTRKKDLYFIPDELYRPVVKPDLDNYIKLVKDAANGVIWKDDNLVIGYLPGTGKYYTLEKERIEFTVLTIGKDLHQRYIELLQEEIERTKLQNRGIDDYF